MNGISKYFVFIIFISCFRFLQLSTALPSAISSSCNCIKAKDCDPFMTLLLNTPKNELLNVVERMHEADCGLTSNAEPKVCCPISTKNEDDTTKYSLDSTASTADRWIWNRRKISNSRESKMMNGLSVRAQIPFDSIETNLIGDYIDPISHRNCPPVLFKVKDNHYHKKKSKNQNSYKIYFPDHFHAHSDEHMSPYFPPHHHHHHYPEHPHDFHHGHFEHYDDDSYDSSNEESVNHEEHAPNHWPNHWPQVELTVKPTTKLKLTTTPSTTTTTTQFTTPPRPTINSPNCGVTLNKRIIGGVEALPGEFPWIARIAYTNQSNNILDFRCTGSFITELHILTAAHCVANLDNKISLSHISLGELNESNEVQTFDIADTIVHPRYDNPKGSNDIAIIKITKETTTTVNYGTICLPSFENNLTNDLTGKLGVVAGWFNNEETSTTESRVRYLRLPILNNTECAERYNAYREGFAERIGIITNMLCTQGQGDGDVCKGDSGGPLMDDGSADILSKEKRYTLLGIVVFGPPCTTSEPLLPGVYMRVSKYIDWITSNLS